MVVVTAVDGETIPSKTVREGQTLATQFDEPHVLLHVMPQDVFDDFRESAGGGGSPNYAFPSSASYGARSESRNAGSGDQYTVEDAERHARGVARDVVEGSLEDDAGVTLQGRVGDPVEEILEEVERRDARYLVIGGRKRTAVGKALFGSATQSLLLSAELPVVTVMDE